MKNYSIIKIVGLGIVILLSTWIIFFSINNAYVIQEQSLVLPVNIVQQTSEHEAVLIINNGQDAAQSFRREFQSGLTAFDLLKESGLSIKTKIYDLGIFIEAVRDKKNGENNKYWMYYVNGEMPMIAADKYELKPGDKVEFKFEKSAF